MTSLTCSSCRAPLTFHLTRLSSPHAGTQWKNSTSRFTLNISPSCTTSKGPSSSNNIQSSESTNSSLPPSIPYVESSDYQNFEPLPSPSSFHGSERSSLRSLLTLVLAVAMASGIQGAPSSRDTFENVPQTLSGGDKAHRIQKPKSAKAETCTRKCVSTCIRGGAGAPGEGPLNVRRPLVVFKEGFRSRQYCLIECSEICNLIGDGDDGP